MKKSYCLYDNKDQDNLLTMAEDIDGVLETSKYYSAGAWFEYDEIETKKGSIHLLNEREFPHDQFPEVPEKRPNIEVKADERIPIKKNGF